MAAELARPEDEVREQWAAEQLELKEAHVAVDACSVLVWGEGAGASSGAVAAAAEAVAVSWPADGGVADGDAMAAAKEAAEAVVVPLGDVVGGPGSDGAWPDGLTLVGGVDISFVKGDAVNAAAALVVVAVPSMDVVYEDVVEVELDQPYVAGFLAFREVAFFVALFDKLRATAPDKVPQIVVVDGNGVLHRRGFGLASHLGVLLDIPTIGIGKSFYYVDNLSKDAVFAAARTKLVSRGDAMLIVGESGRVWGAALRTGQGPKPIFVSTGHRVGLLSALRVAWLCSPFKIPEPVRQADLRSREYVRDVLEPRLRSSAEE